MAILQKKKYTQGRRADRRVLAAVCALLLAMMTAGCGKTEEPIPVVVSSGNAEDMKDDTDAEDNAGENAERKNANLSALKDAKSEEDSPMAEEEAAGEGDGAQQTQSQQAESVGAAELEGNVLSVSQDSFIAVRNETWVEGDASFMVGPAPGYEDEEDKVTVRAAGNCVYRYKTVKNGGIHPEDVSTREGSYADLQEGLAVSMQGNWQDDGSFLADSIVMSTFV